MKVVEDFIGRDFNSLTVIGELPRLRGERLMHCQCKCGEVKSVPLSKLKSGHTKSCGGCRYSPNYKHGMSGTKFYQVWENMLQRVRDVRNTNYGGRGINVSERWENFVNFYDDMFESYQDGLTLDRRDVDGDYTKENCTWSTSTVQTHNRRKYRGNCTSYGVHWCERDKKFIAAIVKNRVSCRIYFDTEQDAAKGYDDASEILYNDRPNGTHSANDDIYLKVIARLKVRNLIEEANAP